MSDDTAFMERTLTVGRPPDEVYRTWRDPQVLPRVMGHFADVQPTGEDRAVWSVHRDHGDDLRWETEVIEADPASRRVRWHSLGDEVKSLGELSVRAAPHGLGSEVTLAMAVRPEEGTLASVLTSIGEPIGEALAATALRRFKSYVETGEIPTLDRNPSAGRTGRERH